MKDKKITGTIENMETGETHDIVPFHFFPCNCALNTIVKILHVESFLHPDNSRQISVDCLALDSSGFVFKLSMEFNPESQEDEQKIRSDITEGKIMAASGLYSVLTEDEGGIMLFDPACESLPPEYSLEEVEEVFRVNNMTDKNRLI
ncbi:MAG TPA: hypothetical protein PLF77_04590 [Smithella sp.]|jgi:hypothetical protein|nr:hypothetical protein [Smithella sp.]